MILSDAMLWRMIWKEYRVQRGFWLVISGFAIVLMLLFLGLVDQQEVRFEAPWIIAMSLPAVYMLGCAAVLFASEREDGTIEMLQIMAARTNRVFLGKVSFCIGSTLAMCTFLLGVASILTWGIRFKLPAFEVAKLQYELLDQAQVTGAMAIQILAWGVLISAICRKGLTAVFLTAVIPLVIVTIAINITAYFRHPGLSNHNSEIAIWYSGIALVVPLIAASYILMQRTMAGRTHGWSLPRIHWRTQSDVNALDRLAAVKEVSPTWQRTLKRLIWLEVKQALTIGHVLWIGAIYSLACYLMLLDRGAGVLGIGGLFLVPLFMGVWTFQSEAGRRIRFLADHGLSPQAVWLSKQLVWGLLTAALAIPFLVAIEIGNSHFVRTSQQQITSTFHKNVPGASAATFAALLALIAYGAGQFASMLIARAVTAGFVGCAIFAALAPLTWLMIELRVPLSISVAPLLVVLIATTYAWSRNWLLEQATWRSWLRLALLLGLSIALVWAGVGVFRVYEVPKPDFVDEIAPLRERHGLPITPDEAATATIYRQALAHLKRGDHGPEIRPAAGEQTAINGWERATESEKRTLADNQESLRIALSATAQPTGAFNDPARLLPEVTESINLTLKDIPRLAMLILLSARELEAQGKLDDALDRYVAVLRLARHVAGHGTMREWGDGQLLESMASNWITAWAAHPEQTAERIEAGATRLGKEMALFPSLWDAVLTQQFMIRHTLRDDWALLLPKYQNPEPEAQSRMAFAAFDRCCPWERARGLRVLDLIDASQLRCLDVLERALGVPGHEMQQSAEIADAIPETERATHTAMNRQSQSFRFGPGEFYDPQPAGATPYERVPWNWLRTTFPLNLAFSQSDHSRIWQYRLKRELSLRTMLLRLKLIAFKKTHGEYPDRLDGHDFGMNAFDPYTGAEFGYRREGFPFAIHVIGGSTSTNEIVNARQPLLWSAGPANVAHFAPMEVGNGMTELPTGIPDPRTDRRVSAELAPVFTLP